MTTAVLEHINFTVNDAQATANRLCNLFDWNIRWQGESMNGLGYTCHVGGDDFYVALYSPKKGAGETIASQHNKNGSLNHIGVVVDDLDAMEKKVLAAGHKPDLHADYEPGRRFYFTDQEDGIEYEIVSYT